MNIRGKGNYRIAVEEAIIKVECWMSGLREKVGPMQYFQEEGGLGRRVEEPFTQKISWEAVDIFWEQFWEQSSYHKNGSSRKEPGSEGS